MTQAGTDTGPFALIPEWVLYAPISDRSLRLYGALAAHADRSSGEAWPSRRRLADLLACSMDSIDRAKQELLDLGALAAAARVGPDGAQRSNLYRIIRARPPQESSPGAATVPREGRSGAAGEGRGAAAQNKSQSDQESVNDEPSLPLGLPEQVDDPRDPEKNAADRVVRAWWESTTPRPTPAGGFVAVRKIVATLIRAGWRPEEIQAALPRCEGWVSQGALEKQLRKMRGQQGGAANPGDLT